MQEIYKIKKEIYNYGVIDFLKIVRNYYLEKNGFEKYEVENTEKYKYFLDLVEKNIGIEKEDMWENLGFHLIFRVKTFEELKSLNLKINLDDAKKSLELGREMSILPLNILLGEPTIYKFIPSLPELYSGKEKHSLDPYGIFRGQDQIKSITESGEEMYIGSRKFDYSVLANITDFCPIGCSTCYKGSITRLEKVALSQIDGRYNKLKRELTFEGVRVIRQIKLLCKWIEQNKEVDTIIISGGEPMMYEAEILEKIIFALGKVPNLKAIRFCTSSVYQGLFFKIDDKILDSFKRFNENFNGFNGSIKKHIYLNCHVTDEHELLTPEARITTMKLQNVGVSIHLQMPIQEGLNFWRNDTKKSAEKLLKISRGAYEIGVIPYKAIVDMHSPSYADLTVPIEKLSEVIGVLDDHFDTSDMIRWQAYNILHEQGNSYVYSSPNFFALKEIDKVRNRIVYFIPKNLPNGKLSIHTYEEPLIKGLNDSEFKLTLNDNRILNKIKEVQKFYKKFLNNEITTKEFYDISGVSFSDNEVLKI